MKKNIIYLVANGDLRASANQKCETEQLAMEAKLISALRHLGYTVKRAHGYRKEVKHSFIDSQKYGIQVFSKIPRDARVIVAEAVWQYSHHILPGLLTHTGPILTVANWSGVWPGLVGMLNLNGSLLKAGVKFSSLWSEDFTDDKFKKGLIAWLKKGEVKHPTPHVKTLSRPLSGSDASVGRRFAQDFRAKKAIMGVFDEGCMGMYNAIIPDEIIHPTGVYKERLSQSSLYAEMLKVKDTEAQKALNWLLKKGMKFAWGKNEKTELTKAQTLTQLKMYIAAVRIADDFGCATIGIQYQQGLKDLAPASDLVEGLLNNRERPPVFDRSNKRELFKGEALPHFNEVDECAGLDGLITYHLWKKLGFEPENTLHDLRWGRQYTGPSGKKLINDYVWVFLISGAAPVKHFIGGYKGTVSERQPPMYFRLGGGTVKGISKPGWIVWSRIFVRDNELHCDLGVAEVIELPAAETEDRWKQSTPQWPIMHTVLSGISRDQMMARHPSNHIQVVYTPSPAAAKRGLLAKAAAFQELGIQVSAVSTSMTTQNPDLNPLLELSHQMGSPSLRMAILGEGNSSLKLSADTFAVKASGTNLEKLAVQDVAVCRFDKLLPLFKEKDLTDEAIDKALFDSRVDSNAKKPSVEALFHAWLLTLPGVNCVGHVHAIAVNQILCSPRAKEFATQRLFPDEVVMCGTESVFIPYVDPGLSLAKAIRDETLLYIRRTGREPKVILLKNHGIIAIGSSPKAVMGTLLMAEKSAEIFVGASALGGPDFMSRGQIERIAGRPDEHYRQKMLGQ